jgi:hypothetical protein
MELSNQIYYYNKLTLKDFKNTIKEMFTPTSNITHEYTLVTGYLGMIIWDLSMLGLKISIPRWRHKFLGKYSKYKDFISIGELIYTYKNGITKSFANSHSNIKAYINRKEHNFDIYNGINYMYSVKDLNEEFFNNIKHLIK